MFYDEKSNEYINSVIKKIFTGIYTFDVSKIDNAATAPIKQLF